MPDVMLDNINNHVLKKGRFSALQKELTIIDFWATWCGACVGSFSKIQELQKRFQHRLQILMVNASLKEDAKKLNAFFELRKKRTGKDFSLVYSRQDTMLSRLFPYKVIPHCVWVDKNRKVIAITDTEAVTADNIEEILNGRPVSMAFKNDALLFDADTDNLLPTDSNHTTTSVLHQSIITGEQPGLGTKLMYESVNSKQVKRMRVLNYSLLGLYRIAFLKTFDKGHGRVEIDFSLDTLFQQHLDVKQRNNFCYEVSSKSMQREQALEWLAADLERYFNVTASIAEKWTPVFILKPGNNINCIYTQNGPADSDVGKETLEPFIINGRMGSLTGFLQAVLKKTVLDETGVTEAIDMRFPKGFWNYSPQQVNQFLRQHGIELHEGERLLPITRLTAIKN
jgi:thiol-disulfide isomerase/thioredoxin